MGPADIEQHAGEAAADRNEEIEEREDAQRKVGRGHGQDGRSRVCRAAGPVEDGFPHVRRRQRGRFRRVDIVFQDRTTDEGNKPDQDLARHIAFPVQAAAEAEIASAECFIAIRFVRFGIIACKKVHRTASFPGEFLTTPLYWSRRRLSKRGAAKNPLAVRRPQGDPSVMPFCLRRESGCSLACRQLFYAASEAVTQAQAPLPRSRDIAAVRLFQIHVHVGGFAEVQVRADANLPPAAADVVLVGIADTLRVRHGDIRVAVKVVQVGSPCIDMAFLDVLAQGEAQPADEAVHAVLMDMDVVVRRVVHGVDAAVSQFRLRLDPESMAAVEALAHFRAQAVSVHIVVAAAGAAGDVVIDIQVGVLGDQVDEAALIAQVGAVQGHAMVIVVAGAALEGRRTVRLVEGGADGPAGIGAQLGIIADLVVVVLVLEAGLAVLGFAAYHSGPDALLPFAVVQLAQPFVHVVVFLTPQHQVGDRHVADGQVRPVLFVPDVGDLAVLDVGFVPAGHSAFVRADLVRHRSAGVRLQCCHIGQFLGIGAILPDGVGNGARAMDGKVFGVLFPDQDLVVQAARIDDILRAGKFVYRQPDVRAVEVEGAVRRLHGVNIDVRVIGVDIGRRPRQGCRSYMDILRPFLHIDRAVFGIELVHDVVAGRVPRSPVLHGELQPGYMAVIIVAVVFFGFFRAAFRRIHFIRTAGPDGILAGKVQVDVGVDDVAAAAAVALRIRCFKDDVPIYHCGMGPVRVDVDGGIPAGIDSIIPRINRGIPVDIDLAVGISHNRRARRLDMDGVTLQRHGSSPLRRRFGLGAVLAPDGTALRGERAWRGA